jgi:glycosyltransferase involved in cell wall biosynthesis
MNQKLDLLFWDPCLSPHKHDFYQALSNHDQVASLRCVIPELLPLERSRLGWNCDGFLQSNSINYILVEDARDIASQVVYNHSTCHILSGYGPTFVQKYSVGLAQTHPGRFFMYAEPRVSDGIRGPLRLLQSIFSEYRLRRNLLHIFAIGANGPKWYIDALYSDAAISSFGYFSRSPTITRQPPTSNCLTIGYIGRYEKSKGYHLFCQLANYFSGSNVFYSTTTALRFVSYGTGALMSKAAVSNVSDYGVLPMINVGNALSSIDLLVAPSISTDDGWNMVICEALLCGTPVICSEKAGASVLALDPRLCSYIISFKPNFQSLLGAFISAISSDYNRPRIATNAASVLSIDSACEHFVKTIDSCI